MVNLRCQWFERCIFDCVPTIGKVALDRSFHTAETDVQMESHTRLQDVHHLKYVQISGSEIFMQLRKQIQDVVGRSDDFADLTGVVWLDDRSDAPCCSRVSFTYLVGTERRETGIADGTVIANLPTRCRTSCLLTAVFILICKRKTRSRLDAFDKCMIIPCVDIWRYYSKKKRPIGGRLFTHHEKATHILQHTV